MNPFGVTVLGPIGMELVLDIATLPDFGAEIQGDGYVLRPHGTTLWQAAAVARLKGKSMLMGRVGSDALAQQLLRMLMDTGVDTGMVLMDPTCTTRTSFRLRQAEGERTVVFPGNAALPSQLEMDELLDGADPGVLLTTPESLTQAVELLAARSQARKPPTRLLIDASGDQDLPDSLFGVDLLLLCSPLAEDPSPDDEERFSNRAAEFQMRGATAVATYLGESGCHVMQSEGRVYSAPRSADPDQPTAYDAFVGTFAHFLAADIGYERTAYLANAAATLARREFEGFGALPTIRELRTYVAELFS